jgi:chromosomal replication initiation ATPase DnaA
MKRDVFNEYTDVVIRTYHISREDLFSKSKRPEIVDARQTLYFLCYNRPMHINFINRCMKDNGYDTAHTTILRGIIAMEEKIKSDPDYANMIDKIQNGFSLTI